MRLAVERRRKQFKYRKGLTIRIRGLTRSLLCAAVRAMQPVAASTGRTALLPAHAWLPHRRRPWRRRELVQVRDYVLLTSIISLPVPLLPCLFAFLWSLCRRFTAPSVVRRAVPGVDVMACSTLQVHAAGPGVLQKLGRVLKEKAVGDFERVFQGTSKTREKLGVRLAAATDPSCSA